MHINEHMAKRAVAEHEYKNSPQEAADVARAARDAFVAAYVPGKVAAEVRVADIKYQRMADGHVVVSHMRFDQAVGTDVLTVAEAAEVAKVFSSSK